MLLSRYRPQGDSVRRIDAGGGLTLEVDTVDLVGREVFLVGFEPEIRGLLHRYTLRGRPAIDVGANIGIHSVVMGRAAAPGRVLACEPNPGVIARLQANLDLNRLENVSVRRLALGEAPGHAAFYVPSEPEHVAGASLGRGVHSHLQAATEVDVEVTTLDALADRERLTDVAVIKVDVEGMEPGVLRGGRELLRRDRPVLIFECTPEWWAKLGYDLEAVVRDLEELGYGAPLWITWRGLRPLPKTPPEAMNLIALPR